MVIWGQKLRQTNVLPGEPLGAAGGFGDAGVAREPRRAATQHALNSKLFLFPGLVCYQFITFIYSNLWEFPVAAELSWAGGLSSRAVWPCPPEHSANPRPNARIRCFLLPQLWGAALGRGTRTFLRKHMVWISIEITVVFQLPQAAA